MMRKRISTNENPRSNNNNRFTREGSREEGRGNRDERGPRDGSREFKPRFSREEGRGNRDERGPRDGNREFKPRFSREEGRGNRDERGPREGNREFKPRFSREEGRGNRDERGPREGNREFKPRFSREEGRGNRDERGPREGSSDFKPRFVKRDESAHFEEKKKQFKERADRKFGNTNSSDTRDGEAQKRFSKRETFKSHNRHEEGKGFTPNYRIDRFKENAPAKIQRKIAQQEKKSDHVRLNRFIANAGICSRRDADKLIESGEIKVNNKVVTEMGFQVGPTDVVRYGNRKLNREKPVYVLLNKPKDFITTTEDPNDRKTVMELVKNAGDARIYPVGRLDRNTTGLLLLTNDGELADRLTHPSHEIEKIYQAELDKPLSEEDFDKILAGLKLEDGEIKVDDLARVTPDGYVIGVKLHSGKNRIVRRIFEHLGYEVTKLDRTTFAGLSKKDLPRGNWRFLTEREVIKLKYLI